MDELKPCQCGSYVELCRDDDDYYIYCPKCKLKTFSSRVYDNITDNCDRLVEVWNRRAGGIKLAEARDEFMDVVYDELSDDADNCRANRIIDAADEIYSVLHRSGEE